MEDVVLPNWDPPGEAWPLTFSYANVVDAESFRAAVEIKGALVATIDSADGSCWLDGVYPGGAAAGGASLEDAHANFREFLTGIIGDMAADCGAFQAFREWLRVFVMSTDQTTLDSWKAGVRKVRSNAPGAPNIERRDSAGWTPSLTIHPVLSADSVSLIDHPHSTQIAA